ncbi:MAG: GNAT family N-acetyltransferase [Angelakisella sp.]
MLKIREATSEDALRICEINKYTFGYEYPLEKTASRLVYLLQSHSDKLFVAYKEDLVIGYIHGSDYNCTYSDPLKNIMAIAVDEEYRGLGAGRLLLDALEQWAGEDGCVGVRLVSGMNREGAHKFYLHCGYALRKEQKNFIKIF